MVFAQTMEGDDDNNELSFITLSAATRNVIRYLELQKQKDEKTERDTNSGGGDKNSDGDNRRDVDQSLGDGTARGRIIGGH